MKTLSKVPQTRHGFVGLIAATAIAATTLPVNAMESDKHRMLLRSYSVERLSSLDASEVYKINWAVRNGRSIIIQGFSPSESRRIFAQAAEDWPAVRQQLLTSSGK